MTVSTPDLLGAVRGRPLAPAVTTHAFVDIAKGLSIVLVIMMHTTLGVGEVMGGKGFLHPVVAFAEPFRIPAFFLVAGLFLGRSIDKPWAPFLDRKVLHFAYLYVLWAAIQTILRSGGEPGAFIAAFAGSLIAPFGTLWFIYLLPLFFVATKLLRPLPAWPVALVAALLSALSIDTGSLVIDAFAARFVFFFVGFWLAPVVFRLSADAAAQPLLALAFVGTAAVLNLLVLSAPALPMGAAVDVLLGFSGALAVIVLSALLATAGVAAWLATIGRQTLAIYLAFFVPMVGARLLLVKTGLVTDIGLVSALVTLAAIALPLLLAAGVAGTPLRYLFERPAFLKRD